MLIDIFFKLVPLLLCALLNAHLSRLEKDFKALEAKFLQLEAKVNRHHPDEKQERPTYYD